MTHGTDTIPSELIKVRGNELFLQSLIKDIWRKEQLPEDWIKALYVESTRR